MPEKRLRPLKPETEEMVAMTVASIKTLRRSAIDYRRAAPDGSTQNPEPRIHINPEDQVT